MLTFPQGSCLPRALRPAGSRRDGCRDQPRGHEAQARRLIRDWALTRAAP